jgi:predicted RNase H-like HicB family nuclease
MNLFYPIAISMGDDKHAWGVEVPDVPGCFSAGEDLDDAITMAREAIEGHIETLAGDGLPIPSANNLTVHAANPKYAGCTWALVEIDMRRCRNRSPQP